MSDARTRDLERLAATGNPLAKAALERARQRLRPSIEPGTLLGITPNGDVVPMGMASGASAIGVAASVPTPGGSVDVNVSGCVVEFFV